MWGTTQEIVIRLRNAQHLLLTIEFYRGEGGQNLVSRRVLHKSPLLPPQTEDSRLQFILRNQKYVIVHIIGWNRTVIGNDTDGLGGSFVLSVLPMDILAPSFLDWPHNPLIDVLPPEAWTPDESDWFTQEKQTNKRKPSDTYLICLLDQTPFATIFSKFGRKEAG